MSKTILVTGGAGFIGSALIRYLINETDNRVINLDKLTYAGNLLSLKDIEGDERYHFIHGDICDKTLVCLTLKHFQPDFIMNLAAESHVDRSIEGPSAFIETNILGTFSLLEAARSYCLTLSDQKRHGFRFHHISTDEVYGELGDSGYFTEESPYLPSSPYSASKAASDHLVRAWSRTYNLPVVLTNCSNNYGSYQYPEKLIPLVIMNALSGKPIPIYGDGKQVRDWLYVDDHVRALYYVVTKGEVGETYNIGGCNEKTNLEVVTAICELLEELALTNAYSSNEIDGGFSSLITYVTDRPGHDTRYAIDAGKIARELNWQPMESFSSGLRKTVIWYLESQAWCQSILTKPQNKPSSPNKPSEAD